MESMELKDLYAVCAIDCMRLLNDTRTSYEMRTEIMSIEWNHWFSKLISHFRNQLIVIVSFYSLVGRPFVLLFILSINYLLKRLNFGLKWFVSGMMSPMGNTWFQFLIETNERHYKTVIYKCINNFFDQRNIQTIIK